MMLDDIYYPDDSRREKRDEKKTDFYLSIQHNNGKLDRVPLTATAYKDFLRHYGDSYLKYIWLESSNSERYAIPKEILMHGIIKIEKS